LSNHVRVPSTVNEKLTTAAPTVDKKLEFSNSNCGKTENCHSLPSDCSSSSDCEYLVTFKPCDDNGTVSFELSGKSDWVAIGFNNESKMDGTEAIICSRLNDTAVIIKHYALVGHNSPIQTNPDPVGMTVKSSAYDDGIIRCRFSLNKNASKVLQLNQKVFLIFARGSVNQGGTLTKHSYKSVSDSQVDVCELERKTPFLLRVHGALMIVAWMGFGFLALSVMTFKKMAPGNPYGKVSWFQICEALTVVCLLFTLAGFVVAFVHFGGWSDGLQKLSMVDSVPSDKASKTFHSVLGCITAFFICVVVILWLFMPATYLESRKVFRRRFGLVAVVTLSLLVFSNVIVGFQMAGMLEFFGYFFIAYTLNMVPCAVLVCCLRDRMEEGHGGIGGLEGRPAGIGGLEEGSDGIGQGGLRPRQEGPERISGLEGGPDGIGGLRSRQGGLDGIDGLQDGIGGLDGRPGGIGGLDGRPGGIGGLDGRPGGIGCLDGRPDGIGGLDGRPGGIGCLDGRPGGIGCLDGRPGGIGCLEDGIGGLEGGPDGIGGLRSSHGGPDDRICGITSKRFVNMTFMFNFTVVIAVSLTLFVSLSDTSIMRLRLD